MDRVVLFDSDFKLIGDTDTLDLDPRSFSPKLEIIEMNILESEVKKIEQKELTLLESKNISFLKDKLINYVNSSEFGKPIAFTSAIMDNSSGAKSIPFTSTAVPDSFGKFAVEIRIPSVIFPVGDYVVKANYGGLKATENFSVMSDDDFAVEKTIGDGNPNTSIPGKPSASEEKDAGGYVVTSVKTIIEKTHRISDNLISIETKDKIVEEQSVQPRVLSGSMVTPSKTDISKVNLQILSESGICIIGQNSDCLVSESTRKPGQIFEVIQLDVMTLNVRYSGPDVRLEKFSILPQSSEDFLPDTNWNVEVLKDDEVSRFYYKVTYKTTQ